MWTIRSLSMTVAIAGAGVAGTGVLALAPASAAQTCKGVEATIVSSEPLIEGTDGDDVILALQGVANEIHGSGGNDLICAGDLDDEIHGGQGVDRLYGEAGADTLIGGEGADHLAGGGAGGGTVYDTVSYETSETGVTITGRNGPEGDVLMSIERLIGSPYRDVINTEAPVRFLYGGEGDDQLGGAMELISGDAGDDAVIGGDRDEKLVGGDGNDYIKGASGADALRGGAGDDRLGGGTDNDRLWPDAGADQARGSGGDDRIFIAANEAPDWADDFARGGPGRDRLSWIYAGEAGPQLTVKIADGAATGLGNDTFVGFEIYVGTGYGDLVRGSTKAERIIGGAGNDRISGRAGADVLEGKQGSDTLRGQAGSDLLLGGEDAGDTDTDVGKGGRGVDRCRAVETASSCKS